MECEILLIRQIDANLPGKVLHYIQDFKLQTRRRKYIRLTAKLIPIHRTKQDFITSTTEFDKNISFRQGCQAIKGYIIFFFCFSRISHSIHQKYVVINDQSYNKFSWQKKQPVICQTKTNSNIFTRIQIYIDTYEYINIYCRAGQICPLYFAKYILGYVQKGLFVHLSNIAYINLQFQTG